MRRSFSILVPGAVVVALLAASSFLATPPASAAPIAAAPTTYCGDPTTDGSMSTGAGTMITCDTRVTNTITAINPGTGVASGHSSISVTECRGPASGRLNPAFLTCSTDLQLLVNLVTRVYQCNGVGYGGGNVLECDVRIINNFDGVSPQAFSAATVDQCVGSAPVTTGCNPFPATTTGATITQCNNSSYGGGQEDFNCLASGTTSASLSVTVNQCNDSNYGGGSWLNCSASLTNNLIAAAPTPTPVAAPIATAVATAAPTATPAGAAVVTPAPSETPGVGTIGSAPAVPLLLAPVVGATPVPTIPDTSFMDEVAAAVTSIGPLMLTAMVLLAAASLVALSHRKTVVPA